MTDQKKEFLKRSIKTISDRRREKITRVLSRRQNDLTVVLENIHDPHNVSAVLRTADAVGVHTLHFIYTKEEFPKIGKKSSASAKKWVEMKRHRSIDECYEALRREGFLIYASHLITASISLYALDLTKPIAFVLGNEHRGVSDEACEKADGIFSIPMMGMIQSLNISVAAAVTMYEALRQRILRGKYNTPQLNEEASGKMIEEWSKR